MRNVKECKALKAKGHLVSLAYSRAPLNVILNLPDTLYDESFKINAPRELWELALDYQVLHCHNHPDYWTFVAQAGPRPVIHDTHDLVSLADPDDRGALFWEAKANRNSQGRVYVSECMYEVVREKYGVDPRTSIVLPSYPNADMLPKTRKARLSAQDGQTHIAYQGRISNRIVESTYLLPLFQSLAESGLHVHIHPSFHVGLYERAAGGHPRLHYHSPLPPEQLMVELTRYDFGLIPPYQPGRISQMHLDMAIPNKLLEYLAVDLPVVAPAHRSIKEILEEGQTGVLYREPAEIPRVIQGYRHRPSSTTTMDEQIHLLEGLYLYVLAAWEEKVSRPREGTT